MNRVRESATHLSWGRAIRAHHKIFEPIDRHSALAAFEAAKKEGVTVLGYGLGRSYGDSNLNPNEMLFASRSLDHFIALDLETGLIRAEAGVSLAEVLEIAVPRGFFLPTTPGSQFVTLAGALANDVHGKNHHRAGCFGNAVTRFGMVRSDRGEIEVSSKSHSDLFAATIGGLGLTGLITWVEFQLTPIESAYISEETLVFNNADEFFEIEETHRNRFEYTVSWIDCTTQGKKLGRGIFSGGNWSSTGGLDVNRPGGPILPFDLPSFALNPLTLKAFNATYFAHQKIKPRERSSHYSGFFYPLDSIRGWNRLYGRKGFFQFQSVIPMKHAREATKEMLALVAASGQGSMLAVLKTFGSKSSPGLMSFPREGVTLALDFKNSGQRTLALMAQLDAIVKNADGRLYPAKDGRISAEMFQSGYPEWVNVERLRDPLISSAFWRRVTRSE